MREQIFGRRWSVWMADTMLGKFPVPAHNWSYGYGVVCKGLEMVYELIGDERYFDYIKTNTDAQLLPEGGIGHYDLKAYNIDNINCGKVLLYLYQKTGDSRYADAAHLLRQQLREHPRTTEGGFWHKQVYPHQMWLDGLYMGQPFYAEYIRLFGDAKETADVVKQFCLMDRHARDPETHLLYHGWDESRSMFWADRETGLSANFWGRSIGWYACALVDTLDHLTDQQDIQTLTAMVQDLASAVVKYQSKRTGVWYQVVDQEERYGNFPEASCSCMFTYFLLKAIRMGYIDGSYFECAKKAFYAITREFIEVDERQLLTLHGTVNVSGLGGDRLRDGSYDYYVGEPRAVNHYVGIGAFMMAAVELERALSERCM